MNSRKLLIYLSIAVVVLIIIALIGKKAGWFGKSVTYEVTTEKVSRRGITEVITANGKIQPETEVKITPDVSGEIVELVVKDGDAVKKGQFLLKIKPDNYISARDRTLASLNAARANLSNAKAMLTQVEARYEQARLSFNRSKKLWDERTISESEWESAQAAHDVAKAEVSASQQSVAAAEYSVHSAEATLKESNENLIRTSIYAPIDGTVTLLNVEKGERVVGTELMSGTDMLRVANLDRMEVLTEVNENDIVRVKLNDSANIEVDAFPDRKFKGIVTEIANSATTTGLTTDQVTNFEVKILLLKESYSDLVKDGKNQPFRPGMSASVDIMTESKSGVLSIPLQSVTMMADSVISADSVIKGSVTDEAREVVFVYDKGKAKITVVKTGIQDNDYIEVLEGLNEEMEVITAPYNVITKKLKDGASVRKVTKDQLKE
ncbi:MAG: efflux RND transporter periplasmic adaptor subunit [Bacteroidales bacterium]|nr:efflux RND transporter periplasmic adaptor subunit [Bacteroidales bacterium]